MSRRLFLFLQGVARCSLFPLGPIWLLTPTASVASVAWDYGLLVLIYILGQWLGSSALVRPHLLSVFETCMGRLASLLVGAIGLTWYFAAHGGLTWLLWTRFATATLCGFLSSLTLSHSASTSLSDLSPHHNHQQQHCHQKIGWMLGAGVSIFVGGLLYVWQHGNDATKKELLADMLLEPSTTSTMGWIGSTVIVPLVLFVGLTAISELFLKFAFSSSLATGEMGGGGGRRRTWSSSSHQQQQQIMVALEDMDGMMVRTRNRLDTGDSEFFDCQSVLSDGDRLDFSTHGGMRRVSFRSEHLTDTLYPHNTKNDDEICQYTDKKCIYNDKSPSYVTQGDSVNQIPECYLEFYRGNHDRALNAWRTTQQWRAEKQVWKIHTLPNSWFPQIKDAYPHFLHGHSKQGFPIVYEQPGKMNLKQLFRSGCHIEDMVFHYRFLMEYVSNVVCTRPDIRAMGSGQPHSSSSWGIMVVMDVQGAGLSHLSGDVVQYLKQAGDTNSAHYPLSMKRAFLVNSPFWLAGAWSGIKGILPDSVQVDILGTSKYLDAISKFIDLDQIPPEYGGSSPYKLGEHPYELGLKQLVEESGEDDSTEEGAADLDNGGQQEETSNKVNATLVESGSDDIEAQPVPVPVHVESSRSLRSSPKSPIASTRSLSLGGSGVEIPWLSRFLNLVTSATRTSLEIAIPLWMLANSESTGGLGFSPFQTVATMLGTCVTIWWALSKKRFERVLEAPSRSFRLGIGLQAVSLAIWATTASSIRNDSFLCIAFAAVILSATALSSQIAWSASVSLQNNRHKTLSSWIGEVLGVVVAILLWNWSVREERPPPFDASSSIFAVSLVSFCLYICSFALMPDVAPSAHCWNEAVAVTAADVAFLLNQSHPKKDEELTIGSHGNNRGRTFSGSSFGAMERGEKVRKAK